MRKIKPYLIVGICLVVFACSKRDLNAIQTDTSKKEQAPATFFQIPENASPLLKRIISAAKKQDEQEHFSDHVAVSAGVPVWTKYETHLNATGRASRGASANDTTVLIPMVKDGKRIVTAFWACLVTKDTVVFKLYRDNAYKQFAFNSNSDTITANSLALQMMGLQYKVFGDSVFRMLDDRLLTSAKKKSTDRARNILVKPHVAVSSSGKIELVTSYDCYDVTHDGDQGQLVGVAPGETNNYGYAMATYCVVSSVYVTVPDVVIGGDGSGNPTSGGSGGSGAGGDPCGPTEGGRTAKTTDPGDCGGDPGWEPGDPYTYAKDPNGYYYARIDELNMIFETYDAAIIPCDSLNVMPLDDSGAYGNMYKRIAQFIPSQAILDRVDSIRNVAPSNIFNTFNIQSIHYAKGAVVNCDFFPVRITSLPTGMMPKDLLEFFRTHIDSLSSGVSFQPYIDGTFNEAVRWSKPAEQALGAVLHLSMLDAGTIMMTDYYNDITPGREKSRFKFSTMESPLDGTHPVAGTREFGVYADYQRPGEYTFYTMGVDRTYDQMASAMNFYDIGFKIADITWRSIQNNMIAYINSHGGSASYYSTKNVTARPDWADVKEYLLGHITFQQLKTRLGC
ncbi:MAG: hypothetical protein J0I41_08580 [Filimonas sp.]|nr:hypothetical protein [Filimonas sp.]